VLGTSGGSVSAPTEGRRALITGITGQDGSYLTELLLDRGYAVSGVVRRAPTEPLGFVEPLRARLMLERADLLDATALRAAVLNAQPDEIYHLAAPSFVPASWDAPAPTIAAVAGATGVILGAARELPGQPRVYVASSAAMFGDPGVSPQREDTPCRPLTPYAIAKLAAHQLVGVMRAHHGLHASSGITFNHESERRPERFVTRKVTRAAAAISLGLEHELVLGDLEAVRDWSFAKDIVRGAWLMLQQDEPADYVLASGRGRTVAELARVAFASVGLEAEPHIRIDKSLARGPEGTPSVGDPSRAEQQLGWRAQTSFEDLVAGMVAADVRRLQAAGEAAGDRN
jgi:GDPmannose 4,6-dehydratase